MELSRLDMISPFSMGRGAPTKSAPLKLAEMPNPRQSKRRPAKRSTVTHGFWGSISVAAAKKVIGTTHLFVKNGDDQTNLSLFIL